MSSRLNVCLLARGGKSLCSLVNYTYILTDIQLKESTVTDAWVFRLMKHSWEAHIFDVVGKVAKVLAALRRLRQIRPQRTLATIYKSLILPHFDYCSAVWGCIGNGLSQKLEKLQNRAARIITGSSWDARSAPILQFLFCYCIIEFS